MATKWEINKAVKASSLPSPSRLIMFALSDSADTTTGVIPEERAPSLREIAEWTGLGKATVIRHLDLLEECGWLVRERPSIEAARLEHAKTNYQLSIGHVSERDMPMSQSETSSEQSMSQSETSFDGSMSHSETGHVSERDQGMSQSETVPLFPDHYQISTDNPSPKKPATVAKQRRKAKSKSPTDRPDVEKICEHLVDRIVANGCKRPTISKTWREEARLLLDKDGRTVDQVIRCIDWATSNNFWRKNILSMPTLREKYDRLRMAAEDERAQTKARASPKDQLTVVNGVHLKASNVANLERAQRMAALDAQKQAAIEGRVA